MHFRSLLFVPGDRPDRYSKAVASAADAVILDLEDSVAMAGRDAARQHVANFLTEQRSKPVFVRINPMSVDAHADDLDAVMTTPPDGLVLPKAEGARDVERLNALIQRSNTPILPIATETPRSIFRLGRFRKVSDSLCGLAWGAEDLSAAIGATSARNADESFTAPFEWVRSQALFAAHAAGVSAVDTVFPNIADLQGLAAYAGRARRDGFTAMLAIHPSQCPVINDAFTPTAEELENARTIVAAFDQNPGAGVLEVNGRMVDFPHLKLAQDLLRRAQLFAD